MSSGPVDFVRSLDHDFHRRQNDRSGCYPFVAELNDISPVNDPLKPNKANFERSQLLPDLAVTKNFLIHGAPHT